jgi:bacterioferritin-associated ferredoxin
MVRRFTVKELTPNQIVCRCNLVSVGDIQEVISVYPNLPKDQIKHVLNIGTRCGCCNHKECPNIDVHFTEIIQKI